MLFDRIKAFLEGTSLEGFLATHKSSLVVSSWGCAIVRAAQPAVSMASALADRSAASRIMGATTWQGTLLMPAMCIGCPQVLEKNSSVGSALQVR